MRYLLLLCVLCAGLLSACSSDIPPPKDDDDCTGGCFTTVKLKFCEATGETDVPNSRILSGVIDIIDPSGTAIAQRQTPTNSERIQFDCGKFVAADAIITLSDETCPGGKAIFVGRVNVTPSSLCDGEGKACLKKKFCV